MWQIDLIQNCLKSLIHLFMVDLLRLIETNELLELLERLFATKKPELFLEIFITHDGTEGPFTS